MLVKLRSCPTEEERAVIDVIDRAYSDATFVVGAVYDRTRIHVQLIFGHYASCFPQPASRAFCESVFSAGSTRWSDLRRLRMPDHKSPTCSIRAAMFRSVRDLGPIAPLSNSSHVHGADTGAPGLARTA